MRDGGGLGRFDGVDRRSDTSLGSGFDSLAFQPRCTTLHCEVATNVITSALYRVVGHI